MNYSEMSDFEINKAVAEAYEPEKYLGACNHRFNTSLRTNIPDYCNNVSEVWPVITKNLINIFLEEDETLAAIMYRGSDLENFAYYDKNPLRAACIVYLMMQEAK